MAATALCSNLAALTLSRQLRNSKVLVFRPNKLFLKRAFATKVRASSTSVIERKQPEPAVEEDNLTTSKNILACPICYKQLSINSDRELSVDSICGSSLQCSSCKKTYYGTETHFELTASSGTKEYGESMAPSTEFFRIPLISYVYERGWRQSFFLWGAPGPEKEETNIGQSGHCKASIPYKFCGCCACWSCYTLLAFTVAEISRVLRPGGVFVATTYVLDGPLPFIPLLRPLRQNITQISGSHIFSSERELEDLCRACGLVNFQWTRNQRFIMISATKPS